MKTTFFPKKVNIDPKIYAYIDTNPQYEGLLKIGFSCIDVEKRLAQQYPTLRPGPKPYKIVLIEKAMRSDGTYISDHDVHKFLRKKGFQNPKGEWFSCSINDVKSAILSIKLRTIIDDNRVQTFKMRPEQESAVQKTAEYFRNFKKENPNVTPHFLWNAKMRFGKTFAAYQLALRMNWKRILVLTFKPAVQSSWEEDLLSHVDFCEWQFVSRNGLKFEEIDQERPLVCFGSFQDYLGKNEAGGIKAKNEWVHAVNWDCVVLDEYHYGAWRENAKDLFEAESKKEIRIGVGEGMEYYDEEVMPITTQGYLYLSGTPFRAISTGEFIEEQIFNWTYSDEQRSKEQWVGENNPYSSLPRMVMLTYQLPESIRQIALDTEFNEFDLNIFFSAVGENSSSRFRYINEVQKWLDFIRGSNFESTVSNLRLGVKKPPFPFSDIRLLNLLSHTFWFLPSVSSCYAMKNLLEAKQNSFYHDHKIIVAAGSEAGMGVDALYPVFKAMDDPLKTKTITLSCGKLTTGVTVRPWTGIFMLRNSSSPETYFQASFRVQSPWTVMNSDGVSPNHEEIIKNECYIFDFAPNRALRQISEYSCRLNINESNTEKKVEEFINFLPILAFDGISMKQIDAAGILDIAMSGTSATLLARRWESALLVNVDNTTLQRILANKQAMEALMNIEGFRNLNSDLETIINVSNEIKKVKKEANESDLSPNQKKVLSDDEKKYKSLRKQIQDKLIKFATRIPVFMYLTDYRERSLKDVITHLEPGLFQKVTGLTVKDFELLVNIGVFNSGLMNDAVYKFKRYEDASLVYVGINKHSNENVGLFDTVLSPKDYEELMVIEGQ